MSKSFEMMADLNRAFGKALGMLPHLIPLAEGIGLFGLEPRVRELASLAVARAESCASAIWVHQLIGRAAGLTEDELRGELDGLTSGELSAVSLALGTVGRPLPEDIEADPPDEHFTSEQIRQLQAVALAVDLDCHLRNTWSSLWRGAVRS